MRCFIDMDADIPMYQLHRRPGLQVKVCLCFMKEKSEVLIQ